MKTYIVESELEHLRGADSFSKTGCYPYVYVQADSEGDAIAKALAIPCSYSENLVARELREEFGETEGLAMNEWRSM